MAETTIEQKAGKELMELKEKQKAGEKLKELRLKELMELKERMLK